MVLRVVTVGALALLLSGCVHRAPVVTPTVVVVGDVKGDAPATTIEPPDLGGVWKPQEDVEVEWHGSWWPAVVLEKRGARWLVHYEGYSGEWDEVVASERIRERHVEPEVEEDPEVEEEPDP